MLYIVVKRMSEVNNGDTRTTLLRGSADLSSADTKFKTSLTINSTRSVLKFNWTHRDMNFNIEGQLQKCLL